MERKELTGTIFTGNSNKKYVIVFGYENGEVVFEEVDNEDSIFSFCCDAKISNGRLYGSYFVNYTVSKNEFHKAIRNLNEEELTSSEKIAIGLRKRYYKIPMAFLRLIGECYMKGCKF